MNAGKLKATDYLVESLKLIVTLSTIFFGGLLAYRTNLHNPDTLWAYYSALIAFAFSSVLSITNINSLINKIFKGDEDAIQHKEAKTLNILATFTLFIGIAFGAVFLSKQPTVLNVSTQDRGAVITDDTININGEIASNIIVKKDGNGKISTVTITPKMANK